MGLWVYKFKGLLADGVDGADAFGFSGIEILF